MGIYTRKGDKGMTDMLSGQRISKDNSYIELLGSIDELTSHIGLVRVILDEPLKSEVHDLQNRLITVMGMISNEFKTVTDLKEDILEFEKKIDYFQTLYPRQTDFVTPGDDEVSVRLDIARSVARRVERQCVHELKTTEISNVILIYFNRLSDYLYAMARMLAFKERVKLALKTTIEKQTTNVTDYNFEGIMTLILAKKIAEKTEMEARSKGCQVVISIVNKDGIPILIHRMDQAFIISFNLARKKAYTSVALKMATHELGKLTANGADFEGLEEMLDEEIITLGGGYPIIYKNEIIGAIGVSGSTVDNDRELAEYGAKLVERMDI